MLNLGARRGLMHTALEKVVVAILEEAGWIRGPVCTFLRSVNHPLSLRFEPRNDHTKRNYYTGYANTVPSRIRWKYDIKMKLS
jgi:hypothetical protein